MASNGQGETSGRPGLRRSLTASATFSSPPKGANKSSDAGDGSKKRHHFFHGSNHDHKHHLSYLGKRSGDAAGSKTSLLHVAHALETDVRKRVINRGHSEISTLPEGGDSRHDQECAQFTSTRPSSLVGLPDVERERKKGELRERELKSSLSSLSELATRTTRRLDQALYSLRQKADVLHSVISSLQEVSSSSKDLHQAFKRDIAEVEDELRAQIDAFGAFETQETTIEGLDARIKKGKQRTDALSARLEASRRRVELWEAREKEWQAKTSKRLTWGWIGILLVLVVIAALLVWRRISNPTNIVVRAQAIKNDTIPGFIADDLSRLRERRQRADITTPHQEDLPTDRRLAAFDEL